MNNAFIAGVGIANIDLIYSGLPRLPQEGEELFSESFSMQLGGGVPATLTNLGRLGIPTRILTALGDDLFSGFARDMFEKSGVEPHNLHRGSGIPVNVTTAMLTPNDRTFCSYNNAPQVTDDMLQTVYEACTGAQIVEMQLDYLEVYRKLKAEGTILVFDTGWDDEMSLEKYREHLAIADYFTPNQKEALKITNTDTPEAAAEVLSAYFEHVIVKLDKDGCLIREHGKNRVIPGISEFVYRDSTGAGDAFLAGFMYGLYHARPFADCVLLGNITGGKCVTDFGCLSAFFDEAGLLEMERRYQSLLGG